MDMIRTFVAVEVGASVRQWAGELIELLRASRADVKWVEPHNMHLTLKFLGDVRAAATIEICQAVAEVARRLPPPRVTFCGAGAFPDLQRPKTIWLGVGRGLEELTALAEAIETALEPLGYPQEARRFHPHLTLGRVRGGGPALRELTRLLRAQAEFEAGETTVQEALVFASRLERAGPTYTVLGRAPLDAAG